MNQSAAYLQWLTLAREAGTSSLLAGEVDESLLQMSWFAGEFGHKIRTTAGEELEIVDFGSWNPHDGPTFREVTVRDASGTVRTGGVEVRLEAAHWLRRAAESPDYEGTLFFAYRGGGDGRGVSQQPELFTRSGRSVPQVTLDVTRLEYARGGNRSISSEEAAAPLLATMTPKAAQSLLEAAAQHRLLLKARRLAQAVARFGLSEALYQAYAETFGYRHNKLPMRLLTQRFPLSRLRREPRAIEAVLFAGSGFLEGSELAPMPGDTRSYLRDLWETWWVRRTEWERLCLPTGVWQLKGTRPANHPQRRVAALAQLAVNWPIIENLTGGFDAVALERFFTRLRHSYWDHHYTLRSRPARTRQALIGENRVADILANVVYPAAVVSDPCHWQRYRTLLAPASNQRVKEAVKRFFGQPPFPRKALERTVLQQGLLQLDDDLPPGAVFPGALADAWETPADEGGEASGLLFGDSFE